MIKVIKGSVIIGTSLEFELFLFSPMPVAVNCDEYFGFGGYISLEHVEESTAKFCATVCVVSIQVWIYLVRQQTRISAIQFTENVLFQESSARLDLDEEAVRNGRIH